MIQYLTFILAIFFECTLADLQYRSRPDLSPPKLNITIPANSTSPGYVFVAPYSGYADIGVSHGPRQSAPYIFTDKGELVWSGFGYFSIWAANFQASKIKGKDVLFSFEGSHNPAYGHGHGHITFLDSSYETVKELRAGNHKVSDKHEFHIVDEKTGLIEIYQPRVTELSRWAENEEQQWIIDAIFQELDIETGELLFEWSSLDHVSPEASVIPINEGHAGSGFNSSDAWDYFHINSVDKDDNGDYLISARHASTIYKINGKTGEIIWRLGGLPGITSTDFTLDDNFTFAFQHHARYLHTSADRKKQVISFFDNSAHGTEKKDGRDASFNDVSSAKIIEVDTSNWTVKLLYNAEAPDRLVAKSQGSSQVLPNGNVFVNWGSEGAITEFDDKSNVLFHAYLDSGSLGDKVQNYRAFKYEWRGYPNEAIALYSEFNGTTTALYVSWNGDTETELWRFYSIGSNGKKSYIGEATKTGFETSFEINLKSIGEVVAEAYDQSGKLLASSSKFRTVESIPEIKKSDEAYSHKKKQQSYFNWRKNSII